MTGGESATSAAGFDTLLLDFMHVILAQAELQASHQIGLKSAEVWLHLDRTAPLFTALGFTPQTPEVQWMLIFKLYREFCIDVLGLRRDGSPLNAEKIPMDDYKQTEAMLKKKWNTPKINTYDVLWSLYNSLNLYQRHIDKTYDKKQALSEVLNRKKWVDVAAATYQANRGHDPAPYLKGANNNSIQQAKLDEYTKGLTVKCYSCCDACMKFDDKTFSIDFLQKTPVLPIKTCTRPFSDNSKFTFCTCTYQSYYEWN